MAKLVVHQLPTTSSTATLSVVDADRPLDEAELEAESKAERYSITEYPRINPMPGTLSWLLRNFKGGNEAVYNFLCEAQNSNDSKFIKNFRILYNSMDEYSKKRIDIWDILCRKYEIRIKKFWAAIQEGMFDNNDALTQYALSGYKPQFVELLTRLVEKKGRTADIRLLAECLGLSKGQVFQVFDQRTNNSLNVQINNNGNGSVPNFAKSIKRTEAPKLELIGDEEEQLQLTEGKQDYIDTEFSVVEEREKVA